MSLCLPSISLGRYCQKKMSKIGGSERYIKEGNHVGGIKVF